MRTSTGSDLIVFGVHAHRQNRAVMWLQRRMIWRRGIWTTFWGSRRRRTRRGTTALGGRGNEAASRPGRTWRLTPGGPLPRRAATTDSAGRGGACAVAALVTPAAEQGRQWLVGRQRLQWRQRLRWWLQAAAPAAKAAAAGDGVVKTLASSTMRTAPASQLSRICPLQGELYCNARTSNKQCRTAPCLLAGLRVSRRISQGSGSFSFRVGNSGWQPEGRLSQMFGSIYACRRLESNVPAPETRYHPVRHNPVPRAASMLRISSAAHDAAGSSVSRH